MKCTPLERLLEWNKTNQIESENGFNVNCE